MSKRTCVPENVIECGGSAVKAATSGSGRLLAVPARSDVGNTYTDYRDGV